MADESLRENLDVAIEIIEESAAALTEYEKVPIAFRVQSRFLLVPIQNGLGGLKFIEESVVPYVKDYDAYESERPSQWHKRFDISHWGIFSAFNGAHRVGGAAAAWKTTEVEMLQGREDLVCLWDLRVHPDYRSKGIGHLLFSHVVEWARLKQCRRLKVETQNINVPACRFYARQGCELRGINRYAYGEALDEIQLLWYQDL
jgi:GNAT superfamily N-acetyltransferase